MLIKKQNLDIAITLLVVLASGNPVFQHWLGKEVVLIGLPMLLLSYGFVRGLRVTQYDLFVFVAFLVIGLAHFLTFGYSAMPAILGFLLKLAAALLLVRTVKDFTGSYVRVMYGLAILSLVFFIPQVLSAGVVRNVMQFAAIHPSPDVIHIGVHNFHLEFDQFRNSGFFWEPGAFAGYLMLAIMFVIMRQISSGTPIKLNGQLWILIIALLTTQSTTGYVALFFFAYAVIYLSFGVRYFFRLLVASVFIGATSITAYITVPFLSEKIDAQIESARSMEGRYEINRFGNAAYDLESIKQRPILGWSPSIQTRSVVDFAVGEVAVGQGNGLTGLMVRFGLVGFAIYVLLAYLFFSKHSGNHLFAATAGVTVLMLLVGEQYLNFPLFMTLMFAGGHIAVRSISGKPGISNPYHQSSHRTARVE